jgi:hypothetical protein
MEQEATLLSRRLILLCALLGTMVLGWTGCGGPSSVAKPRQPPAPVVVKQPVNVATRTFDPANPPADMPPLPSGGEIAQCDSNFKSSASVGGQAQRADATHAVITVDQIKMTLGLDITIWVPAGASPRVTEHEEGHRRISESYYQTADKLAGEIAARYMGKQVAINGADLDAEFHKALQEIGAEITEEYDKELNTNPAQLLYDTITDHSRNDVAVQDAVDHALKNAVVESAPASADPLPHQ